VVVAAVEVGRDSATPETYRHTAPQTHRIALLKNKGIMPPPVPHFRISRTTHSPNQNVHVQECERHRERCQNEDRDNRRLLGPPRPGEKLGEGQCALSRRSLHAQRDKRRR
jgi:hypothetical protein